MLLFICSRPALKRDACLVFHIVIKLPDFMKCVYAFGQYATFHQSEHTEAHCFEGEHVPWKVLCLVWIPCSSSVEQMCLHQMYIFPVISLTFLSLSQEGNNEAGAAGPSGDFEIHNDLGRGVMPVDPDLIGNTVDGGSSAAQLPQKNILERKEVLIGRNVCQ